MIHLFDLATDAPIGTISESQLQALVDALEEESEEDQDYFVDGPTIDLLEQSGADPQLVALLRTALGSRDGMDVRWERE